MAAAVEVPLNADGEKGFGGPEQVAETVRRLVEIGIAGYSLPEDNQVKNIFVMPFRRQRDYWRSPSGTNAVRPSAPDPASRSHMAQ